MTNKNEPHVCGCGCGSILKPRKFRKKHSRKYAKCLQYHHLRRAANRIEPVNDEISVMYVVFHGQDVPVLIDTTDAELISKYRWHITAMTHDGKYKARLSCATWIKDEAGNYKHIKLHRLLLNLKNPSVYSDHKNRAGLDCRRKNLRITTPSGNGKNRHKRSSKDSIKQAWIDFHSVICPMSKTASDLTNTAAAVAAA